MVQLRTFASGSYAGLAADDVGQVDERPPIVLLHGLSLDRTMWRPALTELEMIDPGRRAIALDLPAHGDSPEATSYGMEALVERVHQAIVEAGLDRPVIVGHSLSAGVAAIYASLHSTRGVIAVEGTLDVAGFAVVAKSLEPMLRGALFHDAWGRITANVFGLAELAPDVRSFVESTSRPRQAIVLGYWRDLFERTSAELHALVVGGTAALRASGVPYVAVAGAQPSALDEAWIRANLPHARTLVWPDSGHFPHLAHPRRFADLLAESGQWIGPSLVASATS